jgi:hypothetical protein
MSLLKWSDADGSLRKLRFGIVLIFWEFRTGKIGIGIVFAPSFFFFFFYSSLLIMILSLFYSHLSRAPELCDSPDKVANHLYVGNFLNRHWPDTEKRACYMSRPAQLFRLNRSNDLGEEYKLWNSSLCFTPSCCFLFTGPDILLRICFQTLYIEETRKY